MIREIHGSKPVCACARVSWLTFIFALLLAFPPLSGAIEAGAPIPPEKFSDDYYKP